MFTVHSNEIKDFTGGELVELLRRLLYAEASKAGIPLRGVHVPLQITVADGGQDASISWTGGKASTDYFPGRDIIFQCKAKDRGNVQWEREVWTKPTQAKTVATKVLNDAVKDVIARRGCYIGVTTTALVGDKSTDRVKAIEKGITTAGDDPTKLAAIDVYDGNKLAAWVSLHPGVAVWVKQRNAAIELSGFSTLEHWGKRTDIATPAFIDSPGRNFSIGPTEADAIDFSQLAARLADILGESHAAVRVWGPSGIGKTRALYHALSTSQGLARELTTANFIFCNYNEVSSRLWDVANQIVKKGLAAVLVVDDCPLREAFRLNNIAYAEGSELRVITVGTDKIDHDDHCVMIRPTLADHSTILGILKTGLPKTKDDELDYLAEFCDGFPRIAVSLSKSYQNTGPHKSADAVAQQIIDAFGATRETVRALECLSLFSRLSPDEYPEAFNEISETLVHMKGELMYENLVIATDQYLVGRNDSAMSVQPRPIADVLALRRLDYLRPSTIISFLEKAMPHHRKAMLTRWRYLTRSRTLSDVVHKLLGRSFAGENLIHPDVAQYLPAFTHVEPDQTGAALFRILGSMPLDALSKVEVTDELVDTLRLLAGRQNSFRPAAQIILRLAAVAYTSASHPIIDLLRQIFQIGLAGTQADDRRRREALERALEEDDVRIRRAAIEALGAMIQTRLSRAEDFIQIGAEPYKPEWAPPDNDTVHTYFNWALNRLCRIWAEDLSLRPAIEAHIARDLRNLLVPELLTTIEKFIRDVIQVSGHYLSATESIGTWLYFDSPENPTPFSRAVRSLYDATIPPDPVDQVMLYSSFWASDIHDPDRRYATEHDNPDFEYGARRAASLATIIAADPDLQMRAIRMMASRELNSPSPFAHALAEHLPNPLQAFEQAVNVLDNSGSQAGNNFVRALLSALDRRFADQADDAARLEAIANRSAALSTNYMYIATSLRVTDTRLDVLTNGVRQKKIMPAQTVIISYGKGLAEVSAEALDRFIHALFERADNGGASAALEVLSMVTHGTSKLTPREIELAKLAMLSPSIVSGIEDKALNFDHSYDRMLRLLAASNAIDTDFGDKFAFQIELACRTTGAISNHSSNLMRNALPIVIQHVPAEIWSVIAEFYNIATHVERERLNKIVSATERFSYNALQTGAGALFGTPLNLMLDWVKVDPDARIGFLVTFFPILEQKNNSWAWHSDLETLAKLYGQSNYFKEALSLRIYPMSWGGSLKPHLASFKVPLASWVSDHVLGEWASIMLDNIARSLDSDFYGD